MGRDSYFDTLKWVLIVLVVYGHMISHCYYVGGSFSLAMYNTIYSFHMPLFVFLSGRYLQLGDRKNTSQASSACCSPICCSSCCFHLNGLLRQLILRKREKNQTTLLTNNTHYL